MAHSCKKKKKRACVLSESHVPILWTDSQWTSTSEKNMTSKIREGVEKLIPHVLIFNRNCNVMSTTFPLFLPRILMDMSWCQTCAEFQSRQPVRNALVGGFFVASSPFFRQYFHALNYLISGFRSLHLSWFETMNAAVRIEDNRTTALFVKTKQWATSAFTIM